MMRGLLYEAAQMLLTRVTKWSWLKAWAMQVAKRRGQRRAIVALARSSRSSCIGCGATARVSAGRGKPTRRSDRGLPKRRSSTRSALADDVPRGTMDEASSLGLLRHVSSIIRSRSGVVLSSVMGTSCLIRGGTIADKVTDLVCARLDVCGYPYRHFDLGRYPSGYGITARWRDASMLGYLSGQDWRWKLVRSIAPTCAFLARSVGLPCGRTSGGLRGGLGETITAKYFGKST